MAGRTILSIDVQGGQQLLQKLGRAAAEATLKAPLRRAGERIQRAMQGYPPERAGQTYRRTGNLGRSWTNPVLRGLTATVSENVKSSITGQAYGPFVQGAQTQARMHRGRWITDEEAIRQEAPAIERDFQDAIDAALK